MNSVMALSPKISSSEPKVAPHNSEAEQALLGAILVHNEAFDRVSDFLLPEHFYEPFHGKLYEICAQLIRSGKIASPVTLKTHLGDADLGGISVSQYLARLAAEATTVVNSGDYGHLIYDLALRRSLVVIGEEVVQGAYEANIEISPREQIEQAEKRLYELVETGRREGGFQKFSDALTAAVDMAGKAYEREGKLSGLATGLNELDRMMGGLQASDLVILAGRPGMGKTALATNIAYYIASHYEGRRNPEGLMETTQGGIVGFFSLEMSAEQLATRILSEQSNVPSYRVRRGDIMEDEYEKLVATSRKMQTVPLFIDESGGISVAQLAARARRLKRQKGLDMLVIDYLQLLSGSSKKASEGRVQELTEITTRLKALAKELACPVVALSQLSRQVESREDKRPQLSDLRESGSIEQDADVVMFVYREEYYLKNKKPRENTEEFFAWEKEMEAVFGRAEVIIGKQRHGPTGTVNVQFDANVTRFSNLAQEDHLPEHH